MNGLSVLLVEDTYLVAYTNKVILEKEGYKVYHVSSGEECIEFLKVNNDKIDLILMDIDLGDGINGLKLSRVLNVYYDIPIIFLSSHSSEKVIDEALDLGCFGYIIKGSPSKIIDSTLKLALKYFNYSKELNTMKSIYYFLEQLKELKKMIIFGISSRAEIIYANEEASKHLGYSKSELLQMNVFDIDCKAVKESWDSEWKNFISNNSKWSRNSVHQRKDGKLINVILIGNLILNKQNKINIVIVKKKFNILDYFRNCI